MSHGTRTNVLVAIALLAVVFASYGSALGNGLVSDDFLLFIGFVGHGLRVALSYQGSYHMIPVGFFLLWLQRTVCGLDGALHHAFGLLLFWGLGLATAWLGSQMGFPRRVAWGGALLLLTSAQVFEVPLFANSTLISASATLALVAFGAYLWLVARPGLPRHALFLALFVVAFLCHEQALSVPFACVLWSIVARGERRLGALVVRLLPALAAVGLFALAKTLWNDGTSVLPGASQGIARTLRLFAYHGVRTLVPNLSTSAAWAIFRPETAIGFVAPALLAAVGLVVAFRTSATERALILWALAHVGMMVFAIGMASRHYALPLASASLALASLLARGSASLGGARARTAFVGAIAAVAFIGLVQLPGKLFAWRRASRAVERILGDVERAAYAHPRATRLTVVNLPDGVPLPRAEPAYIFRLGFEDAVSWRLPGRFDRVERRRTAPAAPWVEPFGRIIEAAELGALTGHPENLVLVASGPESGLRVAGGGP